MTAKRPLDDTALAALARGVHVDEPSRETVESMRASVLATLPRTPARRSRRWGWVAVGVAAAAAVAIWQVRATGPDRRGTVTVVGHAEYEVGESPDEIVRLTDGTIHVEVAPLGYGERFRVVTADGVVEVRGTGFDAVAESDHLVAVRVAHGRVDVTAGGRVVSVGPGESWTPSQQVAEHLEPAPRPAPSMPTLSVPAPPHIETKPAPPPPPPAHVETRPASPSPAHVESKPPVTIPPASSSSGEAAFRAGWDALRHDRFDDAAQAFARSLRDAPAGPVAEDATYWRAVALARSGRASEARDAYRAYLASYPQGVRRREAEAGARE